MSANSNDELVKVADIEIGDFIPSTVAGARRTVTRISHDSTRARFEFGNGETLWLLLDSPITRLNPPKVQGCFTDGNGCK